MLLLGLDTATPAVTVAVSRDGDVLAKSTTVDARRHGELLAPAIAAVLDQAGVDRRDLDALAVGVGPGPFTGLRVGLVTARTLAAALQVPVHGVCTLDVLAFQSALTGEFRVATDARRREVYWAAYFASAGLTTGLRRTQGPHVDLPAVATWPGPVVGAGPRLYPKDFPDPRGPEHPSAEALCRWVSDGLPTVRPEPMYLRRPDVAEPGDRKKVL